MSQSNLFVFVDEKNGRRIRHEIQEEETEKKFLSILKQNFDSGSKSSVFGILLNNSHRHYHESLNQSDKFLRDLSKITKSNVTILWGEPFSNGNANIDDIISDVRLVEFKSNDLEIWHKLYEYLFRNMVKSSDGQRLDSSVEIGDLLPGCLFFKVKSNKKNDGYHVTEVIFDSFQTPEADFLSIAPNLTEYRKFLYNYLDNTLSGFDYSDNPGLLIDGKGKGLNFTRIVLGNVAVRAVEFLAEDTVKEKGLEFVTWLKECLIFN